VDTLIFENAMDHAAQAEPIRAIVVDTVAGWGVSNDRLRALAVTEIIRGGVPIGRRFEVDGFRAIWLWDRDVIVFSGRSGQLLKTVSVSDVLSRRPRVA